MNVTDFITPKESSNVHLPKALFLKGWYQESLQASSRNIYCAWIFIWNITWISYWIWPYTFRSRSPLQFSLIWQHWLYFQIWMIRYTSSNTCTRSPCRRRFLPRFHRSHDDFYDDIWWGHGEFRYRREHWLSFCSCTVYSIHFH